MFSPSRSFPADRATTFLDAARRALPPFFFTPPLSPLLFSVVGSFKTQLFSSGLLLSRATSYVPCTPRGTLFPCPDARRPFDTPVRPSLLLLFLPLFSSPCPKRAIMPPLRVHNSSCGRPLRLKKSSPFFFYTFHFLLVFFPPICPLFLPALMEIVDLCMFFCLDFVSVFPLVDLKVDM